MDFVVRTRVGFEPNADVFVDDERGLVIVALEIAGTDPDSLQVAVDERSLLVTGRRAEVVRFSRGSFVQKEIAYGTFSKRVPLPIPVDLVGETTASYTDGLLVIALPVSATAYLPTVRT